MTLDHRDSYAPGALSAAVLDLPSGPMLTAAEKLLQCLRVSDAASPEEVCALLDAFVSACTQPSVPLSDRLAAAHVAASLLSQLFGMGSPSVLAAVHRAKGQLAEAAFAAAEGIEEEVRGRMATHSGNVRLRLAQMMDEEGWIWSNGEQPDVQESVPMDGAVLQLALANNGRLIAVVSAGTMPWLTVREKVDDTWQLVTRQLTTATPEILWEEESLHAPPRALLAVSGEKLLRYVRGRKGWEQERKRR